MAQEAPPNAADLDPSGSGGRAIEPFFWALAGLALCYALYNSLSRAWVCDDAFISFRYAANFVDGLGLVYNAGERVEGYTNFLWVMLVALGLLGGFDPILFSQYLGVLFFVATIALLWHAAAKSGAIPLAAIGLGLHDHSAIFATCGLETSMFAFFVTAGLVGLTLADRPRGYALGGFALILATMSRPDGAIFYACGGLVVTILAWRGRSFRPFAAYAAPFVVVYVPYFIWKFTYYGYPVPNTFYAKSASDPYPGQGLYYVWLYFSCYYYLVPALVAPLWLAIRRFGAFGRPGFDTGRGPLLVAFFSLAFLGYVVFVGGDFMFSRFCLPVTPALLLGLQLLVRGRATTLVLGALVVFGSFLTIYGIYTKDQITPGNPRNVVDEKAHYPEWYVRAYRILGTRLFEVFAGTEVRVAIGGGQAMLGWFGRFPHVLEIHGLTDEHIAHRQVEERGRIGHEKALPLTHEYLRRKGRPIHLYVGVYKQVIDDRLGDQRKFEFYAENVPFYPDGKEHTGFAQATLLTWDGAVMERIRGRPGVRFRWFPDYLDTYLAGLAERQPERVRSDLLLFDGFYFDHNDDPARRDQIVRFLEENR